MSYSPLRPKLYNGLQNLFKHVIVADAGSPMNWRPYIDCYGKPAREVLSAGEYYRVRCPYCNDTRLRLWINHMWGQFDPLTKSRNLWLAHCYNEHCLKDRYERLDSLYHQVFDPMLGQPDPVVKRDGVYTPAEVVWPGLQWSLDDLADDHPVNRYLRERRFDPRQLTRTLHLGYCEVANPDTRMAEGRLIIPVFCKDGTPVGWQARYLGGQPPKDVPKYYNMPGMKKSHMLYNIDRARRFPFVVVCEGPTDVWRVGPMAVALFGKKASLAQLQMLGTYWGNGVAVVLLDGDAPADAEKLRDDLAWYVARRVLVRLPAGVDPSDLAEAEVHQMILAAARDQGVALPHAAPPPASAKAT